MSKCCVKLSSSCFFPVKGELASPLRVVQQHRQWQLAQGNCPLHCQEKTWQRAGLTSPVAIQVQIQCDKLAYPNYSNYPNYPNYPNCYHRAFIQWLTKANTEINIQAPGWAMAVLLKRGRRDYIIKGCQDYNGESHRDSWQLGILHGIKLDPFHAGNNFVSWSVRRPLAVGSRSSPSAWAGYLKPSLYGGMPCSALRGWLGGRGAWSCFNLVPGFFYSPWKRPYPFWGVDGGGLGEGWERRGKGGETVVVYEMNTKFKNNISINNTKNETKRKL